MKATLIPISIAVFLFSCVSEKAPDNSTNPAVVEDSAAIAKRRQQEREDSIEYVRLLKLIDSDEDCRACYDLGYSEGYEEGYNEASPPDYDGLYYAEPNDDDHGAI